MDDLYTLPHYLVNNLHIVWTFLLLITRYIALLTVLPGVGLGDRGVLVRIPASMVMAFATLSSSPHASMPDNWAYLGVSIVSEIIFGTALGLVPLLIVSGVQTGASIASSTMGLSASELIDPTSGGQVPDLSRIFGDITILLFLSLGGHYMVIHAASGLGGQFTPGAMFLGTNTLEVLLSRTGAVFEIGTMISAPIVVALLLTQFVMGLLSKAVPSVNIFIISFPLTIGIGLILSILVLPELGRFVKKEVKALENEVMTIVDDRS